MNQLIVALDVEHAERAMHLVTSLQGVAGAFKVGNRLFTAEGPDLVRRITGAGARVFHMKFGPGTVAAVAELTATQTIDINAAANINVEQAGLVSVAGTNSLSDIALSAGGTVTLDGTVSSKHTVSVTAGYTWPALTPAACASAAPGVNHT